MKKIIYKNKKSFILIILCILIGNFLMVVNYMLNAKMTDAIIYKDFNLFIKFLSIVIGILLLKSLQGLLYGYLESSFVKSFSNEMRENISKNVLEMNVENYNDRDSGVFLSKYINDVNLVINQGVLNYFKFIEESVAVIFSLLGAFFIHWIFIFIFPLSFLIVMIVPKIMGNKIQMAYGNFSNSNGIFTSKLKNLLLNFNLFIYENQEEEFLNKSSEYSDDFEDSRYKFSMINYKFNTTINTVSILANMLHIITTGLLVIYGKISAGYVIGIMNLAGMFFPNAQGVLGKKMLIATAEQTYNNVFERILKDKTLQKMGKEIEKLEVKNLNYSYENGVNLYNNLSFKFEKGKKYLIDGKSGSGKTTLLNILLGNISGYEGEILINGKNIKEIEKLSLYEEISYITQNCYILNDTIRYNLVFNKNISDEEILKILKKVNLDELVSNSENGLDTLITENGSNLSGGQKQRISIARALLSDKKFIVIDEGTTGVDETTRNSIHDILLKTEGFTVVMINHNLDENTKSLFDEVIKI